MSLLGVNTERAFSLSDDCYIQNIRVLFGNEELNIALKEPITNTELANAFIALADSINPR